MMNSMWMGTCRHDDTHGTVTNRGAVNCLGVAQAHWEILLGHVTVPVSPFASVPVEVLGKKCLAALSLDSMHAQS